jgi:AcrR family transcriptional regulator
VVAGDLRDHILEGAYACIAQHGMAKTTVEDVARQAAVSRATVYRYFPGGRDQVLRDAIAWEAARFFERLSVATASAADVAALLEAALLFAHRAVVEHEVLQHMLRTEPATLISRLTVGGDRLVRLVKAWLAPHLEAALLQPGMTVDAAGDYLARMLLSFIGAQGQWDLTDSAQVAMLVRTQFLAGIIDGAERSRPR